MENYLELNKQWWDQHTESHFKSEFYKVDEFLAGASSLKKIELAALGSVSGKSLLHLQCHFGQDTISWSRMGSMVTGVDLSSQAISYAKQLAAQLQIDAQFYESDVQSMQHLALEPFDIVFTSYGTVSWLRDLDAWAQTIYQHLKLGGTFCIVDFHPMFFVLDWNTLALSYDYFDRAEGYLENEEGSYADGQSGIAGRSYYFPHNIASILSSLLRAGLKLEDFQEYDYSPYNLSTSMSQRAQDEYVFSDLKISFPYVFSLIMSK
ncbi:MAG: class I SAM-dependent methyltransferase [Saprospiraceae bacterium]